MRLPEYWVEHARKTETLRKVFFWRFLHGKCCMANLRMPSQEGEASSDSWKSFWVFTRSGIFCDFFLYFFPTENWWQGKKCCNYL